jgi:DNA-binding transcriptional LysR family regulator
MRVEGLPVNVSFRQLRIAVEVARLGSMARAAEALHLTPPAVSMQVKELESQVGLPLFDRQGRTATLTSAGEHFIVHARRLLAGLKDAEHAMARLRQLEQGLLTIGLVSTAKYFVPHLLARFHAQHPGVEVRLHVASNREQLVALMQSGDIDLSIMGRPPQDLDARAEAFARHPLAFVAAPSHPLAAGSAGRAGALSARPGVVRAVPAQALADWPVIVREEASGTRAAMDRWFADHGLAPRIAMEMPSSETIKQAVIAGMGLSFLSLHTVGLERRLGLLQVLPVQDTPVVRAWNVVHLGSKVLSPAADAFRYFMLEHGGAHLGAQEEDAAAGSPGAGP